MTDFIRGPLSSRPSKPLPNTLFLNTDNYTWSVFEDGKWQDSPITPGRSTPEIDADLTALTALVNDLKAIAKATVSFDTDGGSTAPDAQLVPYGGKATEPEDPTKTDYVFLGWFVDGSSTAFDFDTAVKSDLSLKAHWEAAE